MAQTFRVLVASSAALLALALSASAQPMPSVPPLPGIAAPPTIPEDAETARIVPPAGEHPGYLLLPDGQLYRLAQEPPASATSLQGSGPPPTAAQPGAAAAGSGGTGGGIGQQDNGTNPAQNTTTFIASNEFYRLRGGNQINTSYARFKFPIYDRRGSFLLEVPLVFFDFTATAPRLPQLGGLGDVKFQLSFNTWTSENKKLTLINFLEMFVPSADNALVARQPGGNELTAFNLGTGKYVLGPGVGLVYAIQPNFIFAPLYFYEASAAGDDNRPEIRRGKWRIFAMYAWESGLYMLPEFQVLTNYLSGNNDVYVAPEIGYSRKRTILYVKPGLGIAPDTNDREWGIEFGARVQF